MELRSSGCSLSQLRHPHVIFSLYIWLHILLFSIYSTCSSDSYSAPPLYYIPTTQPIRFLSHRVLVGNFANWGKSGQLWLKIYDWQWFLLSLFFLLSVHDRGVSDAESAAEVTSWLFSRAFNGNLSCAWLFRHGCSANVAILSISPPPCGACWRAATSFKATATWLTSFLILFHTKL